MQGRCQENRLVSKSCGQTSNSLKLVSWKLGPSRIRPNSHLLNIFSIQQYPCIPGSCTLLHLPSSKFCLLTTTSVAVWAVGTVAVGLCVCVSDDDFGTNWPLANIRMTMIKSHRSKSRSGKVIFPAKTMYAAMRRSSSPIGLKMAAELNWKLEISRLKASREFIVRVTIGVKQ